MSVDECGAIYGGHLCRQPEGHPEPHTCGEPSGGSPCHAKWMAGIGLVDDDVIGFGQRETTTVKRPPRLS